MEDIKYFHGISEFQAIKVKGNIKVSEKPIQRECQCERIYVCK